MKDKNNFKVLFVYPNLPLMLVPPLAVGLFTTILKDIGYEVDLFDTTHYSDVDSSSPSNRVKYLQAREFSENNDLGVSINADMIGDFSKKIEDFEPDLLIFTAVVEDSFLKAISLLECSEKYNIPHICGGVFPTAAPHRCLSFDAVKVIGIGEGEKIIVEFAEAIRTGKSIENIGGVWGKTKDGTIFSNAPQSLVDINKVLPDFSLFDPIRFQRPMGGKIFSTFPFETYRGCPYQCAYCNSPRTRDVANNFVKIQKEEILASSKQNEFENIQSNFLRRKTIEKVDSEIDYFVKEYNPEFIYFIDDSFLARPKKEIFDFCDMYEKYKIPFWFNTRPENCTPDNMARLKEVGCYRISFGIECGNYDYRSKILKRNGNNEKIVGWFKIIEESRIPFSINLIIGFPGETKEMIMDTVELARDIRGYDSITVSIFTPYHGTPLRDIAVKNGWLDDDAITVHTTSSSILEMPKPFVSSKEIDGLMRVIPLYCFFPKDEWPKIERAEIDDEEGNKVLKHYSEIYKKDFLKDSQDDEKEFYIDSGTGCKASPKDSYRLPTKIIDKNIIDMLTL